MLRKLFEFLRSSLSGRSRARPRPRYRPALDTLEGRLAPAVLVVDSPADNTAPDDVLTLREAVAVVDGTLGRALTPAEQAQVSGAGGSNTILFSLPGPQMITLTGGELDITQPVAINGPGPGNLTIDGNHESRVFTVGQDWSVNRRLVVSLSGLTVANGLAPAGADYGGGLLNFGSLTLSNMVFVGNVAGSHGGGGVYNVGTLTVAGCTFAYNSTAGDGSGGGLYNNDSGRLTVVNTTFVGNSAGVGGGGGISNIGRLTVVGCTFSNNTAVADGGGMNSAGGLTVRNTTFAGNSAGSDGGGLWTNHTARLSGCTLSGNDAASAGGGLYNSGFGILTLVSSTLWGNTAGSTGGGMQNWRAATLRNVTITANRAVSGSGGNFGGGIYNLSHELRLRHTSVTGNFRGPAPGTTANDLDGQGAASGRSHRRSRRRRRRHTG
jgi:hypothetical protein